MFQSDTRWIHFLSLCTHPLTRVPVGHRCPATKWQQLPSSLWGEIFICACVFKELLCGLESLSKDKCFSLAVAQADKENSHWFIWDRERKAERESKWWEKLDLTMPINHRYTYSLFKEPLRLTAVLPISSTLQHKVTACRSHYTTMCYNAKQAATHKHPQLKHIQLTLIQYFCVVLQWKYLNILKIRSIFSKYCDIKDIKDF